MRAVLYLAWRYVTHEKWKSAIMSAAVFLTIVLPAGLAVLVRGYERGLYERATATPLVLGPRGSHYELLMRALYFRIGGDEHSGTGISNRPGASASVPASLVDDLNREGLARAIPLHVRHWDESGRVAIVGVGFDYFQFRRLVSASGRLPALLGEVVLGSEAAETLGVHVGDPLLTQRTSSLDLMGVRLGLTVVGVLRETGGPDDSAAFIDIRTAWLLDGLGHGHQDVTTTTADPAVILRRDESNITANAAIEEYVLITAENAASFHFHGDERSFPLTAVIVEPIDDRARTILAARDYSGQGLTMMRPVSVVAELMGVVLRIKGFVDASYALFVAAALLFMAVTVLLSVRLRVNERQLLARIGGGRWLMFQLIAAELAIVVLIGSVAAGLVTAALWVAGAGAGWR